VRLTSPHYRRDSPGQHIDPLGLLLFAPGVDQPQGGYRHHVGTSVSRGVWPWAQRAVTGFFGMLGPDALAGNLRH
jgi:hypothetical protein